MLELTENAIEVMRQLSAETEAGGLRIFAEPGAGDELILGAVVVDVPAEYDELVEEDGARVYLDPGAAAALDDKLIDTYVEGGKLHLAVREQS